MKAFQSFDILFLIVLLNVGSIMIFYFGFMNSATTLKEFSTKENPFHSEMRFKDSKQNETYKQQWFPVQSSNVVITLFDGVMYNWVVDKEKMELAKKQNKLADGEDMPLPFPLSRLRSERNKTLLFNGFSDPPTMTAAKVKAFLEGTLPDIIEIISNIRGNMITTDNIVYQERYNSQEGKAVVYYGQDFWADFVGHILDRMNLTQYNPLLQRITEIDFINYSNVEYQQLFVDDWSTLYSYYQIVDVAAHNFKEIGEKLYPSLAKYSYLMAKQTENAKRVKVNNKTDTTLIYFSDHGENPENRAMHGGKTDQETSVFIFGYDTRGFIPKEKHDIGQIMDKDHLNQMKINQMDLAPTYCMLRGLPIPMNSIGMIIPDFFIDTNQFDNTVVVNNFFINVKQIHRRIKEIKELQKLDNVIKIEQAYQKLFDKYEQNGFMSDQDVKHFVNLCLEYGRIVKSTNASLLILPNQFWSSFSVFCCFTTLSVVLLTGENLRRGKVSNLKNLRIFQPSTRDLVILFLLLLISPLILEQSTWLIWLGISFCAVSLLTLRNLFQIIRNKFRDEKSNKLLDTSLVVLGILFNGFMRWNYKYFAKTQDLEQILFFAFYIIWGMNAISKNDKNSILRILLIAFLIFITTYFSSYQDLQYEQLYIIKPLKEMLDGYFWRFSFPAIFISSLYLVIFLQAAKTIRRIYSSVKRQMIYQSIVGGLLALQILCIIAYFNFEGNRQDINDLPIMNYFVINYCLFFLGQIFKSIFLKQMPFTWKFTMFLLSFFLTQLISIGFQSVFLYSATIIILYCLGQLSIDLTNVTRRSKYIFLSLFSTWIFYASDHMEKIESIHIDLFNIGQIGDGVLFPIVNGINNHLFGQIMITLIIPIFVNLNQYDDDSKISFLDYIFANVESSNRKTIKYEAINQKSTESNREKNVNVNTLTTDFLSYTTDFFLPAFFSFFVATLRCALDPQNENMNSDYLPSFLFQILFSGSFILFSTINYFLNHKYATSQDPKYQKVYEIQTFSSEQISKED